MKLIPNAGRVWHRLWSVRLSLLNTLVMAAGTYWFAFADLIPPKWFMSIGIALSLAPAVARIVMQKDVHDDQ